MFTLLATVLNDYMIIKCFRYLRKEMCKILLKRFLTFIFIKSLAGLYAGKHTCSKIGFTVLIHFILPNLIARNCFFEKGKLSLCLNSKKPGYSF